MSDAKTPDGPDFAEGAPSGDLPEGGMLQGRFGEEAVLVARVDGVLHAIGGECTHYHAPLGTGLLKDGTVRCPWHHACFSLKTGEALGAPAFDPLPCYKVVEADGKIVVEGKAEAEPGQPPVSAAKTVLIIGGGAAGFAAAEMLRRKGYAGDVTMLSADEDAPYDRPNCSKDFLTGEAPDEWMPLKGNDFYKAKGIGLHLNTEVESLDTHSRTVTTKSGETFSYDVLILATGGEPQRPKLPGFDGENVFLLRSLKDARALASAAGGAKTAAIIGSSFIGLEAAAALKTRGLDVHVVAPEAIPFEKTLGAEVGRWVKGLHEEKGVVFHLGAKAQGYANGVLSLETGPSINADIVVVGVGVKPRVEVAEASGLKVDNGVVVDDRLRAAEGVYAVGDIARYPDPLSGALIRVEHWVHAQRQGQHVARLILGEDKPFTDPPFFWSAHFDSAFRYDGHAKAFDPPEVEGSLAGSDAAVRYRKDGALLAILTVKRDLENLAVEAAFQDGHQD
jgi:NADPH-dependent 2,4-dienoyl-CoA reductase/sulfur reductase-like enzyme/nitrite reductase/ring-hydroxylating ferredoxin subunit